MAMVTDSRKIREGAGHRVSEATEAVRAPVLIREAAERVAKLQALADRNIVEFHLLDQEGDA